MNEERAVVPDKSRPHVWFIPRFNRLGMKVDGPTPWGQSTSEVFLKACGSRAEQRGGRVRVTTYRRFDPPSTIVSPYICSIDGFSLMDPDRQANTLGYLAMSSGMPGLEFPESADPVELNAKQMFAIAQLALKSLGSDISLVHVDRKTYPDTNDVFGISMSAKIAFQGTWRLVLAECLHQKSPVRDDVIGAFAERVTLHHATGGVVFTTSTFARALVKKTKYSNLALILLTSGDKAAPFADAVRIAVMDEEIIRYPACRYWLATRLDTGEVRFVEVKTTRQVRARMGWPEKVELS